MKKLFILFSGMVMLFACTSQDKTNSAEIKLNKNNIDEIVNALTLDEKASLLIGTGMKSMMGKSHPAVGSTQLGVNGAAGTTVAIPRLGIPFVVLADGPAGLRISPTRKNDENTYYCTAFPVGTLLASTWDTALVESVGATTGNEMLEYGVDVILGPGMNIQRNPLCGRNFEYFSEDPYLTGTIASAMVNGIQSNGVGTSVKHFALNNQETNRNFNDARVSERAMREIYLKGYEIVVKDAQPWTVMSSYNKINGTYAAHNHWLLTEVLRDDWGFEGLVMTDWFGGRDAVAQVTAGNDLQEPGRKSQKKAIIKGVENGTLSIKDVNTSVKRVLELVVKSPGFNGYKHNNKPDLKTHAAVARQAATEGMILLENNGALPFSIEIKNIALFGTTSYDFISGGMGSGDVNEEYTVSLAEGIANAGYTVNESVKSDYDKYYEDNGGVPKKPKNALFSMINSERLGEFIPSEEQLASAVSSSDAAIITIGRNTTEGKDHAEKDDFLLTNAEQAMIKSVCNEYHNAGKQVVVVLNIGGVIETTSWKNLPDAVLLAWQAGQEGGNSVADILKGNVNPSGKLPMTFPVALSDHASTVNFPTEGASISLLAITGIKKDKKPDKYVRNIDYTEYEEGIYVGYRHFDKKGLKVSYPFGYGLSYTTFAFSDANVERSGGMWIATVNVTNTGKVAGKEVVELYVSAPESDIDKPNRELKAFTKTKTIAQGESQTLTMTFTDYDLASFHPDKSEWITDAGTYQALFGASVENILQTVPFELMK
ncbi:MAG: glycoside hydrolase family 3 C-terminal domain-containing protein [Bacteroidia bacterium]|nr:glycoside hydrolase family 3 C-terminal domain-containing protein [Bacteroidia bacterium]